MIIKNIFKSGNHMLWLCIFSAMLVPLNSTMIATILPDICRSFNLSMDVLTLYLIDLYLIINLFMQIIGGKIGDRFGKEIVLRLGYLLMIFGSFTSWLCTGFVMLAVGRVILAIGGALIIPNTIALLCDVNQNAGKRDFLGILNACLGFAAGFGPLVSGMIADMYGWQAIFIFNIPVLFLSYVGIIRNKYSRNLISIGVVDNSSKNIKISNKKYYNFNILIGCLSVYSQNMILYGLLILIPFYFSDSFNKTSFVIGKIIFVMTVCMAFSTLLVSRLKHDRRGRYLVLIEMILTLLGMIFLILSMVLIRTDILLFSLFLIGISVGAGYGSSQILILKSAAPESRGLMSGIGSAARYFGAITGAGVYAAIYEGSNFVTHINKAILCALTYFCFFILFLIVIALLIKRDSNNQLLVSKKLSFE